MSIKKNITYLTFILLCSFPRVHFASESFDFFTDVLNGFEVSKAINSRIEEEKVPTFTGVMKKNIVTKNAFIDANSFIEKYQKNENEILAAVAQSFSLSYRLLVSNVSESILMIEEIVNNPEKASAAQGTFMRRSNEIMVSNEEAWRSIFRTVAISTNLFVDSDRLIKGKTAYLTITKNERNILKSRLIDIFGSKVKKGMFTGQVPIDASGGAYWTFLSNDKWKASDDK